MLVEETMHRMILSAAAALALLTVLGPFWVIATAIALFDVGMPVFFWQQGGAVPAAPPKMSRKNRGRGA